MAELSDLGYIHHFAAMLEISFGYYDYKVAVYDGLFGGMVYGRGQETRRSSYIFLATDPACEHRHIYCGLRDLCLRPPVSFTFKGRKYGVPLW